MPNHCYNRLTVVGAKEILLDLVTAVAGDECVIDFEKIVPGRPGDDGDWYAWSVENWGTKWPAWSGEVEWWRDDVVQLKFTTAWSPAVPVVMTLARRWPGVVFHHAYGDEFCNFSGWALYEFGQKVASRDYDFDVAEHERWFDPLECIDVVAQFERRDGELFDEQYIEFRG